MSQERVALFFFRLVLAYCIAVIVFFFVALFLNLTGLIEWPS